VCSSFANKSQRCKLLEYMDTLELTEFTSEVMADLISWIEDGKTSYGPLLGGKGQDGGRKGPAIYGQQFRYVNWERTFCAYPELQINDQICELGTEVLCIPGTPDQWDWVTPVVRNLGWSDRGGGCGPGPVPQCAKDQSPMELR
jgi:hypothetical protein